MAIPDSFKFTQWFLGGEKPRLLKRTLDVADCAVSAKIFKRLRNIYFGALAVFK